MKDHFPNNAMERAVRYVTILSSVPETLHGRRVGRQDLARACECDVRTIQRAVGQMRDNGLAIEYDIPTQTYFLPHKGLKLTGLTLTYTDVLALAAARAVLGARASPFKAEIDSALDKITAGLTPTLAAVMEDACQAIGGYGYSARDYSEAPLLALTKAITRRETLDITYESRSAGETRRRKVDPYRITGWEGGYLGLAGWCHDHCEVRTFALDRIVDPTPTGEHFDEQPWDERAEGVVHGIAGGSEIEVVARFHARVARAAREHNWRFKAVFEDGLDGSVTMRGRVRGPDGIVRELISWRGFVEVLGCADLRKCMREEISSMAKLYAE